LPQTAYYGNGEIIARTGWDMGRDSPDMLVNMIIRRLNLNNHDHLDSGHFTVFYKEGLAVDSGIYQGVQGGYGSPHDLNWNKRTISHNAVLLYDRNAPPDTYKWHSRNTGNDGGQVFPAHAREPVDLAVDENGMTHVEG
jgi:hypothetical protein